MQHPLFQLITTPDRAIRLVCHGVDHYEVEIEKGLNDWIAFSNLSMIWMRDFSEEKPFRNLQAWVQEPLACGPMVELFRQLGGALVSIPAEADLLISKADMIIAIEHQWQRKLVVSAEEMDSLMRPLHPLSRDLAPPKRKTATSTPLLSNALHQIWKHLKSKKLASIQSGLEKVTTLIDVHGEDIDPLLADVGIDMEAGTLLRGTRFQHGDHLMVALLGLLSRAPDGSRASRIRESVRRLEASIPSVPELKGFTALEHLDLRIRKDRADVEPAAAVIAELWGAFPALRLLRIDTDIPILNLADFNAPSLLELEATRIGLQSLTGLESCNQLQSVNLNWNEDLEDLTPLRPSLKSLKTLKIVNTGILSLNILAHAEQLCCLDLDNCYRISNFSGLERLSMPAEGLKFSHIKTLTSLSDLPLLDDGSLIISDLPLIRDLSGLEWKGAALRRLNLWDLPELTDISALARCNALEEVSIIRCGKLANASVLAQLPRLRDVSLHNCQSLFQLPQVWPDPLTRLSLDACAFSELGALPEPLLGVQGVLDLRKCDQLHTLAGLEKCVNLTRINLCPSLRDVAAISSLADVWLRLQVDKSSPQIPQHLIEALAQLPHCKLEINEPVDSNTHWRGIPFDLSPFGQITHLEALDISALEPSNLSWILALQDLKWLRILPHSYMSKQLGGCKFDTPVKINKMKMLLLGMG